MPTLAAFRRIWSTCSSRLSIKLRSPRRASAVAVGWSGYAVGFLDSIGMGLPEVLTHGPTYVFGLAPFHFQITAPGVNLPAIFIIFVVAGLLMLGTRESATLNAVITDINLAPRNANGKVMKRQLREAWAAAQS